MRQMPIFARPPLSGHAVPAADAKQYRSPFLRDFWHLNVAMWTSNNALIPDPDKEDVLASKPLDWPLMHLGLRMCGWGDQQTKYYLIGLPVIWWGGSISLILATLALGVYLMRQQRKYVDMEPSECFAFSRAWKSELTWVSQGNGNTSCMCAKSLVSAGSSISVSCSPSPWVAVAPSSPVVPQRRS